MPRTLWGLENFSAGLHTKPGRVDNGELYAHDIQNLQIDNEGWLSLRKKLEAVRLGGQNITGAAATADYVLVLRADGKLYIRAVADLATETEVTGVKDMSGRLSVISPFGNYAILTSEGTDQGYWIDLREGEARVARPLGLDKPVDNAAAITKYPSDSLVETTGTDDVVLQGSDIFVAYAISYAREFEVLIGKQDADQLFAGMESELSTPKGFIFKRLNFKNDDHGPSTASTYQMAAFDFSVLYSTTFPLSLGRSYKSSGGTENTHNLREDSSLGGIRIGYTENEEGALITALTGLTNGEKIVCRPSSGDDVVITLSANSAVADNPATPNEGGLLSIATANYTKTGTFVADRGYNVYPANSSGTIKGLTYPSNLPEWITGVSIYRSVVINKDKEATYFDQITDLFLNDTEKLDLAELSFRRIAYIPRDKLHQPFTDGIFAVKGDNADQIINTGDAASVITYYRNYYHTIKFENTNFTGIIAQPPPESGIKKDYPWYADVLIALGIEGFSVGVYGEEAGNIEFIPASSPPFPLPPPASSVFFYKWSKGVQATPFHNERLPSEVNQIHYYAGRIYAPRGDRLLFSDIREGSYQVWAFPPANEVRPPESGRIDFAADFQEILLFGGRDGLWRLRGPDPVDFSPDRLSGLGPVDGHSYGIFRNALGFVGDGGLFITDGVEVHKVSDLVLDEFFEGEYIRRGSVLFVSDDTILFHVVLRGSSEPQDTRYTFLWDDGHWVRWTGDAVEQFMRVVNDGEKYYAVETASELKSIDWNGENTDASQAWLWESNWIDVGSEKTKRFTWLRLSANAGTQMTLTTWINNDENPRTIDFTTRDGYHEQRVRVERRARRMRFRLSGTGPLTLRGVEVH